MKHLTKKRKSIISKIEGKKLYNLKDAAMLLKDITTTKFDSAVDIAIRLGVDVKKSDQMVRGTARLPHGTGKTIRVLVLCTPENEDAAKAAGADFVGLDEYIEKITGGWTDIDVIITSPNNMSKIGKLGKILGPRNLMPNPKLGTVTNDIPKAVKEVKAGKIDFKIDKAGIIHTSVGKVSFTSEKIIDNVTELLQTISKLKPPTSKGIYFKSISISTTMSPGIFIEPHSVNGLIMS